MFSKIPGRNLGQHLTSHYPWYSRPNHPWCVSGNLQYLFNTLQNSDFPRHPGLQHSRNPRTTSYEGLGWVTALLE